MNKLALITLILAVVVQVGCWSEPDEVSNKNRVADSNNKNDVSENESKRKVTAIKAQLEKLLDEKKKVSDVLNKKPPVNPEQQSEQIRQLSQKINDKQPIEDTMAAINDNEIKQIQDLQNKLEGLDFDSPKTSEKKDTKQETETGSFDLLITLALYSSAFLLLLVVSAAVGALFGRRAASKAVSQALERAGIW